MAESNWYWAEGDQKNGPVAGSAIARLVADGKLGADDMIWKEGMAQWIPVSKVPSLIKYLKKAPAEPVAVTETTQPAAEPSPASVSYYNPTGGLPPRAAQTLRKHAAPKGDVGDWPLDDSRVAQFDQALKLRKKIDSAASLFRLLLFLAVIGDAVAVLVFLGTLAGGRGPGGSEAIAFGFAMVISLGITVLYYFAWKSTVRSQRWAPLTMGILFTLGGLFYVVVIIYAAASSPRDASSMYIVAVVVGALAGAFAFVSFKALSAIAEYLTQPAWCQELLSKTSS